MCVFRLLRATSVVCFFAWVCVWVFVYLFFFSRCLGGGGLYLLQEFEVVSSSFLCESCLVCEVILRSWFANEFICRGGGRELEYVQHISKGNRGLLFYCDLTLV